MSELGRAAYRYAQMGVPVFRLRPGGNTPFPGTNGFKDATTDLYEVKELWQASPEANIGGVCGEVFSVVDIDSAEGWQYFRQMRLLDYFPDPFAYVRTTKRFVPKDQVYTVGGVDMTDGGAHVYIAPQPGIGRKIGDKGFVPGCDFLGDNGYVVMPPSVIDDRCVDKRKHHGTYTWTAELQACYGCGDFDCSGECAK